MLLTDGFAGTDVGTVPLRASIRFARMAVRATWADKSERGYRAVLLEVYDPSGPPPLHIRRSVVAANDGGRWVFETSGEAYAFEETGRYQRRPKRERFTGPMLHRYLEALGVPVGVEPTWAGASLVR